MIKVRIFGKSEVREVSLEEAQNILEETYNNSLGGIVVDAKTRQTLSQITIDTKEIMVIEQMLGGG